MWQFSAIYEPRWSEITHEIEKDSTDEALAKHEFGVISSHGSEDVSGMKIYRGPRGQYYVIIAEFDTWMDLMIADFPSLMEFVRLYGQPYMQMNHTSEIHEVIEELRDLLLDRGTGHFRQIVREADRIKDSERKRIRQKYTQPDSI